MKAFLALSIIAVLAFTACGRRKGEKRDFLESRAASTVLKFIQLHEAQFPDRTRTNLAQIAEDIGAEYPHDLHREFEKAGGPSGFTNSFYEKFVFAPAGVRDREIDAEIVALTALPVRDVGGQMVRVLIERKLDEGTNWGVRWVAEPKVQQYFSEAGATIPKPAVLHIPPSITKTQREPSYSLSERIEIFFRNRAEDLGLGRNRWVTVLATTVFLFLFGLVIVIVSFLRRSRS